MDKKQTKLMKWLNELEQYAKEKQLSIRIIDGIEDCKRQAADKNLDWNKMKRTVDEVLESVESKAVPAVTQESEKENEVSIQVIREQVKKMALRCQNENKDTLDNFLEPERIAIKKSHERLREISYTKAHIAELKDEELLLGFFRKCKKEHENDMIHLFQQMLDDISNNYNYMLEHMRSMLRSAGGYKIGIGSEKVYHEYEERKEGIKKKLLSEAQSSDVGGKDIEDLGQKCKSAIKKITKKHEKKRKLFAWIPLLILLCCFMVSAISTQEQNQAIVEEAEKQNEEENSVITDMLVEKAIDYVKDANTSSIGNFLSAIVSLIGALAVSLGAMLIFILLMIILLYTAYVKILRKCCDKQICKQCEKYLNVEFTRFEQQNVLVTKTEMAMKSIVEGYEQQYLVILNNIFCETTNEQHERSEPIQDKYGQLKEAWNQLKYE
ncbi:MAG: hypothetical protein IJO65_07020 [Lachnospiraceae bacterium]|nr:hypothetical protein [Lachnospiraceae bacterium]